MKINYVVCVYLSKTARSRAERGLYHHVTKQIEAFEELEVPDIKMLTFVVNDSEYLDKRELERRLGLYKGPIPFEVKYRNNWGRSYGAWEYHIRETIGQYDYYFLMEDDYYPVADYFYTPFVNKMKGRVGFVCMWFTNHPAFCLGLISTEVCKDLMQKEGEIFINYNLAEKDPFGIAWDGYNGICCDKKTRYGGVWQNCFHFHIIKHGWEIKDMREYPLIFRSPTGGMVKLSEGTLKKSDLLILPTINNIR